MSGDRRIGVLANPSGQCEPELNLIAAWARDVCVEVVDLGTSAEPGSLPADCEIVIALGGDGKILRALQLAMTNQLAASGLEHWCANRAHPVRSVSSYRVLRDSPPGTAGCRLARAAGAWPRSLRAPGMDDLRSV